MKKVLKNPIFTFILGLIVAGGIGVSAYAIIAKDVSYTPKDTSWNVDNVKGALDDLYTKSATYKKLSSTTTASASDILNGKTAYDNNGSLITGTTSITDCVKGSFTCTTCTTSSGQKIGGINFNPNTFVTYGYNTEVDYWNLTYNKFANSTTYVLYSSKALTINNGANKSAIGNISDNFDYNNGFIIKNFSSSNNNQTFYYIACK